MWITMESWIKESPVIESAIDLFQPQDTEKGLALGGSIEVDPISQVNPFTGPIIFKVESNDSTFFQLHKTRLVGRLRVVKGEDTKLTAADRVKICNYLPHSLFKQYELYLQHVNSQDISSASFHYKAFLENEFSYDSASKQTLLACEMGTEEDEDERAKLIAESKEIQFDMRVPCDLFGSSTKFLPPGINWQLRCTRQDPSYGLILEAGEVNTYKIQLLDLKLVTRKIVVSPFALEKYRNKLSLQDSLIHFKSGKLRFFQIPKGLTALNIPSVVTGQLPQSLLVGFVLADDHSGVGDLTHGKGDPYKFQGFNLSSLNVKLNGNNILSSAYKCNFETEENLMYLYKELLMNTGYANNSQTIAITYD